MEINELSHEHFCFVTVCNLQVGRPVLIIQIVFEQIWFYQVGSRLMKKAGLQIQQPTIHQLLCEPD